MPGSLSFLMCNAHDATVFGYGNLLSRRRWVSGADQCACAAQHQRSSGGLLYDSGRCRSSHPDFRLSAQGAKLPLATVDRRWTT